MPISELVVLQQNFSPTVVLNTPSDAGTTTDTTPTLDFTGTDLEENDIRYNVNISSANFNEPVDDFRGTTINKSLWTVSNTTRITQTSDVLQFTTLTSTGYYDVRSVSNYDLTGRGFSIQTVDAGNQSLVSLEVYPVMVYLDDANQLFWFINGNVAKCYKRVTSSNTQVGTNLSYSAATHKYFRIRESGGTTYWDWSTDNSTWTNHTSTANPITVTSVKMLTQVGTYAVEGSGTTVQFDNANTGYTFINAISGTDAGFANPDVGGDTDPFTSGDNIQYTVQSALSLGTYYWRVRGVDPDGVNVYGPWSSTYSFTVNEAAAYTARRLSLLGVG